MKAKHPGTCHRCRRPITPGQRIKLLDEHWIHGGHAGCIFPDLPDSRSGPRSYLDACRLCRDYIWPGQHARPDPTSDSLRIHAPKCPKPRQNRPSDVLKISY